MPINQQGIDLIKHFEGLELKGYLDPVGIPTIVYGHTGPEVRVGQKITEQQAENLLRADLVKFANGVRDRLTVAVSNNAFAALVAFSFNVGLGAFGQSTMRRKLNGGDKAGASAEFLKWVKATKGGKKITLPGLVRRRKAERKLFDTADSEGAGVGPGDGAADGVGVDPLPPSAGPDEQDFIHVVAPGETFSEIAMRNGFSIDALLNLNPHIADPDILNPGDLIRFTGAAPVGPDPAPAPDSPGGGGAGGAAGDAGADMPWYASARGEIGVSEVKGKRRHNNRIIEYHRSTKLGKTLASRDETPWCSSFVNWCMEQNGMKGTDSALARSWLNWGEVLAKPTEGCVVVFARPKAGKNAGHVGFYVRETAERIRVLGGNQSNKVQESNYGKGTLLGYRWPKGKPAKPQPPGSVVVVPEDGAGAGPGAAGAEADTIYIVQHGDTLGKIATRAGVSLDEILRWNPHIANPDLIMPGDNILLVGIDAPDADEPPLPADSKATWYALARREIGVTESAVSNNPRILEYHASTTLPGHLARRDETPWCSSFVNWCIAKTGLEGTNSARARSWEKWGSRLRKPREGCIVVLTRPAGGANAGHVGFYVRETATHIRLLGGNQANSVKESNYPKSRLIGYRWPAGVPATGPTEGAGAPGRKIRRPFFSRFRLFKKIFG